MSDTVDNDRTDRPWTAQPPPTPNSQRSVHDTAADWLDGIDRKTDLAADLRDRGAYGLRKYGTPLQPGNGRHWDRDLYEELLDAVAYAEQGVREERERLDRLAFEGGTGGRLAERLRIRTLAAALAEQVRLLAVQPR